MASVARKAEHVKAAPQSRQHTCHWPGCTLQVPPAKWGCTKHWYQLPIELRNKIWAAYRIGQEEDGRPSRRYVEVAIEVRNWIRQSQGAQ